MRVLVTGSSGLIGSHVVASLTDHGHDAVGFDVAKGQDILNPDALRSAAEGCEAILHLAACTDHHADDSHIMSVNLLGTWNVLSAAKSSGVGRVVFYSSVNALGVFMGDRPPDYLPVDDDHPCYPSTPYGISKYLAEQMCHRFTDATGIPTVCLRPPGVWAESHYEGISGWRKEKPENEWTPFWEYGAFLDARDAALAGIAALRCPDPGHTTLLLCAADISTSGYTSREIVNKLLPDVPWRGGAEFDQDPYRALIDTRKAQAVLAWAPRYTWRAWTERAPRSDKGTER